MFGIFYSYDNMIHKARKNDKGRALGLYDTLACLSIIKCLRVSNNNSSNGAAYQILSRVRNTIKIYYTQNNLDSLTSRSASNIRCFVCFHFFSTLSAGLILLIEHATSGAQACLLFFSCIHSMKWETIFLSLLVMITEVRENSSKINILTCIIRILAAEDGNNIK